MINFIKKSLTLLVLVTSLILGQSSFAADEQDPSGVLDDSIRDFSIVLGAGAAGAVLGLSTLSFVEEPSKHFKNVFVGGAIGIVLGVGAVIFSQASRSSAVMTYIDHPVDKNGFESITKKEFIQDKIAQNYLLPPSFGVNLSF